MKTKVYDLPTRLLHWLFAGLFLTAFAIAKIIDDESPTYALHMLLGMVMVWTVVLRLAWGVVGSRYARLSSFSLHPKALTRYLGQVLTGARSPSAGHNPASSWAALILWGLALGLGITGYLMSSGGNREALEDIHELLANAMILVTIAHVAGLALHAARHRDALPLAMISGDKEGLEKNQAIPRSHAGTALVFLALIGAFVFQLGKNYDRASQQLSLFGTTLQLGEAEGGAEEGEAAAGAEKSKGNEGHEEGDDD